MIKRLLVILVIILSYSGYAQTERSQDFNFDWKFTLVEETEKPTQLPLNDADWRDVRLPHDWSVEASFGENLEGCTGYLPGGVGVYQKHFKTPSNTSEKNIFVLFDGVYNNATFWLNGKLLGENPYGYSPTYFELTKYLKTDGSENIITVHVDHSRYADSRWYTGSGIYRNVKLISVNKLHIPIWGTFVTTPEITNEKAVVSIETKVKNSDRKTKKFVLTNEILDGKGSSVSIQKKELKVSAGKNLVNTQLLSVSNPKLWNTDTPNMYTVVSTITLKGKVVDTYTTPFGIRSLETNDQGFFLNGKSTYVKGVCIHHDGGLVGSAVPKGVWRRRLASLKEGGCNAIRTSHNPFSKEFLDLCDEMGFLVQNEIFDEMDNPKDKQFNLNERSVKYITRGYTEHFQKWGESDLTRTILRDRNHPSVFQWSIGNEIEWTYPDYKHVSGLWDPEVKGGYWNKIPQLTAAEMQARYKALPDRKYKLAETAKRLSRWVKKLDTTRPVTANLIIPVASLASGYADALDVVGFSYQTNQYNWSKKNYPNKLFTGSENSGSWQDWNSIIENPMVFSMYMWTGIDYLGEANEKWPQKGWDGDMLDFAGFKKTGWNYFKSIWVNKPHVSIATLPINETDFTVDALSGKPVAKSKKALSWNTFTSKEHWNYKKGDTVLVEVSSNHHIVELFLNGKSLGSKSMSECQDRVFRWAVPFEVGVLTAKAGFDGAEVISELKTTSEPVSIKLTTDKTTLTADGYDVAHIIAQLVDKDGNAVKTSEANLTFEVEGNAKVLGVDNGSNKSIQDFQSNKLKTSQGRGLLLIQSLQKGGEVLVKATSASLYSKSIHIKIQ
ncbi:glycoside hydrolase family 2 TIM barrel-domain containing protein [Lutibacter citreus]|uniref:glycoside hydrolase family 2 TIM barrel-domain containing protein n=1 Tax=Lutibacter citreus TaxID=2138210 RepID=UPI0015CF91FD|nr:glycoside hydrolase family 2 TIM barrel-domain containing protein [Lutibacter citreus]